MQTIFCILIILSVAAKSQQKTCHVATTDLPAQGQGEGGLLSCPQVGDPLHYTECCGDQRYRRCCPPLGGDNMLMKGLEEIPEPQKLKKKKSFLKNAKNVKKMASVKKGFKNLPKILGVLGGLFLLIVVVVVTIICCYCLPCCFWAKRRKAKIQEEGQHDGEGEPAPAGQPADGEQDGPQYAF